MKIISPSAILTGLWIAAIAAPAFADMASLNKTVQRFANQVINSHNAAAVDRLFTKDYRQHTPMARNLPAKAFKQFAGAMFRAFPDVKARYTPILAQGDRIAFVGVVTGTHRGNFFGMPATGKRIRWTEMHIFRVRGGRIAEHWVQADMFGIVQQIRAAMKKK